MLLEEIDAVIWLAKSELVEEANDETDELELLETDELLEELELDDTEEEDDDDDEEIDDMLLDDIEAVA